MPGQESLQALLDRLLTVEQRVVDQGRFRAEVDGGRMQITFSLSKPGKCVGATSGIRLALTCDRRGSEAFNGNLTSKALCRHARSDAGP